MKKVHPVLLETINQNLSSIFIEGLQTDKVVQASLKSNPKYGSRDRKFLAKVTYDIVRWWRTFHFNYTDFKSPSDKEVTASIYQYLIANELPIPNWEKLNDIDKNLTRKELSFAERSSIPDWLDKLGEEKVKNWEEIINAMNNESDVVLRCNTLKTTPKKLIKSLEQEGIAISQIDDHAFIVDERKRVTHTKAFQNGLFEIQDYGSQKIAPFLDVQPNETVIDACSGAGGKTLHLANIMQNRGHVTAMDIYDRKLKELQKRSSRNGYSIIETNVIKGHNSIKRYKESTDRLLLDVPCSGLGVLKRNPGTKWFLKPDFLTEIQQTQQHILSSYSTMLKPGGTLVYATCSILPDENQNQVQKFLSAQKDFELIQEETISPETAHSDGYYMAKLIKKS